MPDATIHAPPSHRVIAPRGPRKPVIVEIPHAGIHVDAATLPWSVASLRSVARDADLYVDELFVDAPDLGATVLVSNMSRFVCDLNRSEADIDRLSVQGAKGENAPHGIIWRRTSDGDPSLIGPLPVDEFERRRDTFYRPYHHDLRNLIEATRAEFGFTLLLCAHSMPSRGKPGTPDAGKLRADVVPGTRGATTASPPVIEQPGRLASKFGWTLKHDHPYRGGFTTGHYGRPALAVHALQIELSRSLYMDESTLVPHRRARETRDYCSELVLALGQLDLSPRK